jgi:hypothetical protein
MTWKAEREARGTGADRRSSIADNRAPNADGRSLMADGPIADSRSPNADGPIADNRTPDTTPTTGRPPAIPDRSPPTKTTPTKQPLVTSPANLPTNPSTTPDKPADPTPPKPTPIRSVRFNAVNVVTAYVDDATDPAVRDRIGPFSLDLGHGTHRLRFTNPLAYESEMNLQVDDVNPAQLVVVRLQPLPAKLFVDSAPDGAMVEVAGRTFLVNAQTRNEPIFVPLPLGAGSQSLEVVVRRGDLEWRKVVDFKPGQERRLDVNLDQL